LRIWRNGKIRAVKNFVQVIGNIAVAELSHTHGLLYRQMWVDRVANEDIKAKTANKDIGHLSRMMKGISILRRLNIPDIFAGLRLKGEEDSSRVPFENEFIQDRLLAPGALDGLNEDARYVLYVIADSGLRPSEIVNLRKETIHLQAHIPYVEILPDGRRPKTKDAIRTIPLVGAALAAMRKRPNGFPRYRDKSSGLSATLNKFLLENGLRPTLEHTVYSMRHSFKDRLIDIKAEDSIIDVLMGHKTHKPKYGKGPSLARKLEILQQIAFAPPEL
jgi:integrase